MDWCDNHHTAPGCRIHVALFVPMHRSLACPRVPLQEAKYPVFVVAWVLQLIVCAGGGAGGFGADGGDPAGLFVHALPFHHGFSHEHPQWATNPSEHVCRWHWGAGFGLSGDPATGIPGSVGGGPGLDGVGFVGFVGVTGGVSGGDVFSRRRNGNHSHAFKDLHHPLYVTASIQEMRIQTMQEEKRPPIIITGADIGLFIMRQTNLFDSGFFLFLVDVSTALCRPTRGRTAPSFCARRTPE
jgi:hypothetical protein